MMQRILGSVMTKKIFNKKVSSIWKMEDRGHNPALFYQIQRYLAPHGHLMGEYSVHLPALSGQVRVYIALQGDVGVGVAQQFAEGLHIASCLQAGGSKGVAQHVRAYLPDSRLFQIHLDAFPIAAGFGGLGLVAGQKPCSIADASTQLFQHNKQLLWEWNFPTGGASFRRLDDYFCVTVSAGNSADRSVDFQCAKFQVKIAPLQTTDLSNTQPQFQA